MEQKKVALKSLDFTGHMVLYVDRYCKCTTFNSNTQYVQGT